LRKNKKKIIYSAIGVLAIAILSIMIIYNSGKRTNRDKMSEEEPIDKEQLEIEFNDLFTNEENQYVSTLYKIQEEKSGKYKIDAYIPRIHLDNKIDNEVNNEINSSFVNKILQVYNDSKIYTILKINYATSIQDNRLSVIIKCSLKEGSNAQRTIIKTYNYDIESKEKIKIVDLIQEQKKADLQEEINQKIQLKLKKEATLAEQGYNVYRRDVESDIYKIENANEFYIKDKILYIIYCYGNNSFTSEVDLIVTKI
jgi:hypothetical protein